jgi:hypothetical protein
MNGYVSNWRLACHNTVGICMNGYVSNWRLAYHNSQSAILVWIASQILCGSSVPCVKGPTFFDNYRAPLWRLACYLLPLAGCIFFGIFGLVVNSQAPTLDNFGVATVLFSYSLSEHHPSNAFGLGIGKSTSEHHPSNAFGPLTRAVVAACCFMR